MGTSMRSIWNGTISFGLINIPVKLYPAIKSNDLSFHYLHDEDSGRIKNERVCQSCGKNVDYKDLVRGYEYEKGKYIKLTDEDLEKVEAESSKSMTILDFVDPEEIDPMFFDKPYYIAPDKKGEELYVLLRESLKKTKKVAIVKFVMHEREHLAVLNLKGSAVMLDMLHFADEIKETKGLSLPAKSAHAKDKELDMAVQLVESMTTGFDPDKYRDTYREALTELINKKLEGKTVRSKPKAVEPTNVTDIMAKLKASIQKTEKKSKSTAA